MRNHRATRLACVLCAVLCTAFLFAANPRLRYAWAEEEPELVAMASAKDLLSDALWLKQSESGKCTLSSTAMMLRRATLLNGGTNWRSITEDSIHADAWHPDYGLRWSFTSFGLEVGEYDLSYSDEEMLIDLLDDHPEGVVIYNWSHAVLLTDYTDGVLYCADPAFGDRRPLTRSSRGVRANNVRQVWYVVSYVAPPTGDSTDPVDDTDEPIDPPAQKLAGTWMQSGSRWWYQFEGGTYAVDGIYEIDGTQYAFDASGWMRTGWWRVGDAWYYSRPSGALATGWVLDGGTWYWLDDEGVMATGWKKVGGTWYCFASSGAMRTGWYQEGSTWYWLDDSGALVHGWRQIGGSWYYFDGDGKMATDWLSDGNTWYWLGSDGAIDTGWRNLNGSWYYFAGSGAMATGWVNDGGSWYLMDANGVMLTGWAASGGSWYYLDGSGRMVMGWVKDAGQWYYLDGSGAMVRSRWVGNYYLGADGIMLTSTVTPDGYRVLASGQWDGNGRVA